MRKEVATYLPGGWYWYFDIPAGNDAARNSFFYEALLKFVCDQLYIDK
jgi:hypothetical protein